MNTLGFQPKPKSCRQTIRIERKNLTLCLPIRIEYHYAQKHPRALGQCGGPFWAQVGSLLSICKHGGFSNPPPGQHSLLLLTNKRTGNDFWQFRSIGYPFRERMELCGKFGYATLQSMENIRLQKKRNSDVHCCSPVPSTTVTKPNQ